MQGLLVLTLACMDSSLWLDRLVSDAVSLEAVFEVLVNERGFEEEAEEEEALQAQEAAWAVLAAVSRQAATADIAMQVRCPCRDSYCWLRLKLPQARRSCPCSCSGFCSAYGAQRHRLSSFLLLLYVPAKQRLKT